ncbi:MAG TPA: glycosyl transferase family 90 [Prolixibacteraceae bacterium]|nr:glycosyl transferase family 90 [Prolixibacteraceae bacterium]
MTYALRSFFMKNNKFTYYSSAYFNLLLPRALFRKRLNAVLKKAGEYDESEIHSRVEYYNKLSSVTVLNSKAVALNNFKYGGKLKTYFFDSYMLLRYFPLSYKILYLFGDITTVPEEPSLVKSRPINNKNHHSVLLKLNAVRHFNFITDRVSFRNKKDKLLGRFNVYQPNRERFLEMYFGHRLCNVGQVNNDSGGNAKWLKPKMSLAEHLKYKFILCLEGNDVATNLKWVMSSNSIAVMPRPTCETWFMEGKLIPGRHYIEIAPDYSDVEKKLNYYIDHPEEAEKIIKHAHTFVKQFKTPKKEKLISLLVLQKYFEKTGQTNN